jgi:probable rRNA maturation factor
VPVRLRIEDGPYRGVPRAEVLRRARFMLESLQLGNSELSIVLTGDDQIQKLNKLYRDMDRPTDVLAFAMREGRFKDIASALLGDVVVSVPRARHQAGERSVPVMTEITMLIAHGILHLIGWDHDTPAKDRRMRTRTDRLCEGATRSVSHPRVIVSRASPRRASRR